MIHYQLTITLIGMIEKSFDLEKIEHFVFCVTVIKITSLVELEITYLGLTDRIICCPFLASSCCVGTIKLRHAALTSSYRNFVVQMYSGAVLRYNTYI